MSLGVPKVIGQRADELDSRNLRSRWQCELAAQEGVGALDPIEGGVAQLLGAFDLGPRAKQIRVLGLARAVAAIDGGGDGLEEGDMLEFSGDGESEAPSFVEEPTE